MRSPMRPETRRIVVLLIMVFVAFFGLDRSAREAPTGMTGEPGPSVENVDGYPVVRVVDGDTVRILADGGEETLRLIGINTPETVDPRRPVQCFGKEASEKAKEILSDVRVLLEDDPTQGDRDKYGRLLRYVLLPDGTNFNRKMIEWGYAYEYTYDVPYRYQAEFKEAERHAREEGAGLWSAEACDGKS